MAKVPFKDLGIDRPFFDEGSDARGKDFENLLLKIDDSHAVRYVRAGGVDGMTLAPDRTGVKIQINANYEIIPVRFAESPAHA